MPDTEIHIGVHQRVFNDGGGEVIDGYAYGTEQGPDGTPKNNCFWKAFRPKPGRGWIVKVMIDHDPTEGDFLKEVTRRLKKKYPSTT